MRGATPPTPAVLKRLALAAGLAVLRASRAAYVPPPLIDRRTALRGSYAAITTARPTRPDSVVAQRPWRGEMMRAWLAEQRVGLIDNTIIGPHGTHHGIDVMKVVREKFVAATPDTIDSNGDGWRSIAGTATRVVVCGQCGHVGHRARTCPRRVNIRNTW
jgi:hypothetical protein